MENLKKIICPRCNGLTLFKESNKENICPYCYYNFLDPNKVDERLISSLYLVDQKLLDKTVFEILGLKEENYINKRTISILKILLFLTITFYLFSIDEVMFPVIVNFGRFVLLLFLVAPFTTYFFYKYLTKVFYLEELAILLDLNEALNKSRASNFKYYGINVPSKYSIITYLLLPLVFFSFIFSFFAIYAINDFSSYFSQEKTYKFISKNLKVIAGKKGGTIYSFNFSDYNKTNPDIINIKVDNSLWDSYNDKSKTIIKVRKGLIANVVWDLKP